jgi:hypothetical protein
MGAIRSTRLGRRHRNKGHAMTLTEGIVVAFFGLLAAIISGLLAARNASKQVQAERERTAKDEEAKRDALLASVHQEAATSGRELYQQLCGEQQARIDQQHKDLAGLSADVTALRSQLTLAQSELIVTRHELVVTQDELRKTRTELQETRDLLTSTKAELLASRDRQQQLETESQGLRLRVKALETELATYKKTGG